MTNIPQPALLAGSWQDANAVLLHRPNDPDWIYRAVTDEGEKVIRHIEAKVGFERLTALGFVRTEVVREEPPRSALPLKAIVRHQRIRRVIYPAEWTMPMWREALAGFCDLNLGLMQHGLCLVDAHPTNILFDDDGKPVFIDFGSLKLQRRKFWISRSWHREFKNSFLLPILLHNFGFHDIAQTLKREPFECAFKKAYPWSVFGLLAVWLDALRLFCKLFNQPALYFKTIKAVLCRSLFGKEITRWTDYKVKDGSWSSWKHQAVGESLANIPGIQSVFDLAGNKGTHILEAARLGKTAILADIDEASLEAARVEARRQNLPLFIGKLDICRPTPESGKGLLMNSSFDRLRSDLVMALAVSHHLQYRLNMPFRVFAAILDRYSNRYVLAEYVDLSDVHVKKWIGKRDFPPLHYTEPEFVNAFTDLDYRQVRRWESEDKARAIYLFEKRLSPAKASAPADPAGAEWEEPARAGSGAQ